MEIERKYLIENIPLNLKDYPCLLIEQGYLNTKPVVRVRRQNDDYYLTYKSSGMMAREEYNLPLDKEAYDHLITKADGIVITKKRYLIPLLDAWEAMTGADVTSLQHTNATSDISATDNNNLASKSAKNYTVGAGTDHTGAATNNVAINPNLTVELDIFEGTYAGLQIAEVEFGSTEEANAFTPPSWFGEDVTFSTKYHNSRLSQGDFVQ